MLRIRAHHPTILLTASVALTACASGGNQANQTVTGSGNNNLICQQYSNCEVNPPATGGDSTDAPPPATSNGDVGAASTDGAAVASQPPPAQPAVPTTPPQQVVVQATQADASGAVSETPQWTANIFSTSDMGSIIGQTSLGVTYEVRCRIPPSPSQPGSVSDGGWYLLAFDNGYVAANTFQYGSESNGNAYDAAVPVCS
jgi:hypothetical protein